MVLSTNDKRLKEAVELANKYFESQDFQADVVSINKFENSNVTPNEILRLFNMFNYAIEVKCTHFGWFFRNVLGRTVGDGYVYVNAARLNRTLWSVGATIVHEASHVVDEFFPKASFGHGSNSSKGKGKTFPYFIDEKAENWIKLEVLKKESNRLIVKKIALREVISYA